MKTPLSSWIIRLSLAIGVLSAVLAAYGPLLGAVAATWINATVAFLSLGIGLLRTFSANEPVTAIAEKRGKVANVKREATKRIDAAAIAKIGSRPRTPEETNP